MKLCTVLAYAGISLLLLTGFSSYGQLNKSAKSNAPVYVDKEGVMRWSANNKEASFFGVNYTTPFAYAYRAHKALNVDLEKAIRQDVYHIARLGFDAFRVHVWDTEISDVEGNLLENDHLRLYDFLLAELKKRGIRTIVTPIAFWGNGYPERDEDTPGFSRFYGRSRLTTSDSAIVAQENYLNQFFRHVNPYTNLTYGDDPDVIAVEINNEPSHRGPKAGVTEYINRLAAAIKSTGWSKPVFYNISQGPYYADAVAASAVDGFSFQWYPSGLVSGSTLKGNYLPNVDKYTIPFDTIPAFAKKALMVYEFDAADILQSCMYPAMARSFREAGFQWATQFAYDPLALACANTEYQTHYLNLAFTPSKAISMLIASNVFHVMPRLKDYGSYPDNSSFGVFRVSYKEDLSEMNTDNKFYYSNSTLTKPVRISSLLNIAGVGTSPVVAYKGTGAYFLDKLEDGVWRLEVMPDAIQVRDPFERPSPKKEVMRIEWRRHEMKIMLPELGDDFSVGALNEGNSYSTVSDGQKFEIEPGSYLLTKKNVKFSGKTDRVGPLKLNEFVAPRPADTAMYLYHEPYQEVTDGEPLTVHATVVGVDTGRVSVLVNKQFGSPENIPMVERSPYHYSAEIPAEMIAPGVLNYRIMVKEGDETSVFPGNIKGNPFAWDNVYQDKTWKTYVAGKESILEIFNATTDRGYNTYPAFRRGFQSEVITGEKPSQLILSLTARDFDRSEMIGFQFSFVEKLKGREAEMDSFDRIVLRARSTYDESIEAKVTVVDANAAAASAVVTLSREFQNIEVPLSSMTADAALLMPRPYPGFLPLTFKCDGKLTVSDLEKVEVTVGPDLNGPEVSRPRGLEIACIWLRKSH